MTRLDEIEARLAEPPAAQDEFLQTGREWRAIYGPQTPFPPNYGIAVQMASDLSRARTDLAALVKFAREVEAAVRSDLRATLALVKVEELVNALVAP